MCENGSPSNYLPPENLVPFNILKDPQQDFVPLIALGYDTTQVAEMLSKSNKTIEPQKAELAFMGCTESNRFNSESTVRWQMVLKALIQDGVNSGYIPYELDAGTVIKKLTPKEVEVMESLMNGDSIAQFADKDFVTVKTIESHRRKIYSKLSIPPDKRSVYHAIARYTYLQTHGYGKDLSPLVEEELPQDASR